MAAVRIVIEAFGPYSATTGFPVFLDCWRATFFLQVDGGGLIFVNGTDAASMFGAIARDPQTAPVVFGGMIRKGEPVNMNSTLQILPVAGGVLPVMVGYVIKEYFDPSLPDPVE